MKGYVYFIKNPANGRIKIGQSVNPHMRISALNTEAGRRLKIIGVMKTSAPQLEEARLHHKFAKHRVSRNSDWFKSTVEPELAAFENRFVVFKPRRESSSARLPRQKRWRGVLRLQHKLFKELTKAAKAEQRSFNALLETILSEWITARAKKDL